MASSQQVGTLEALVMVQLSKTAAQIRAYYQTFLAEQSGNTPVAYHDWLCVVESANRNLVTEVYVA